MTKKEFDFIHEFLQALADSGRGIRNPDTGETDVMLSFKQINNFSRRVAMLIDEDEHVEMDKDETENN